MTVNAIVTEYFNPGSPYAALIARAKAAAWVCQMSRKFNRKGRMFGKLNDEGEYGFAKNEEEAKFIGIHAYTLTKGHLQSSAQKLFNGQRQNLLKVKRETLNYSQPVLE